MEALNNEQAQFDAKVLDHVQANTQIERERLAEEKRQAEARVAAKHREAQPRSCGP